MRSLRQDTDFLGELAKALHVNGAAAHRLETAIQGLAANMGWQEVQVHSAPTSIQLFTRSETESEFRMIRVRPGEINIDKLQQASEIGDQLINKELSVTEALSQLKGLARRAPIYSTPLRIASYAAIAGLLNILLLSNWTSVAVSTGIGLLIGGLVELMSQSERLRLSSEMAAAFFASFLAQLSPLFFDQSEPTKITLAALIVLIPGLTLTTSLMELATQHLVAGTARMMGAAVSFMKLIFGVYLGKAAVVWNFEIPTTKLVSNIPDLAPLFALPFVALTLAPLFQIRTRDFFWLFIVCSLGYVTNKLVQDPQLGAFMAAFSVSLFSNGYARVTDRPASTLLLPGILLLVPGSIGYLSLISMQDKDYLSGLDLGFKMYTIGFVIVGGILMGQYAISPKKSL